MPNVTMPNGDIVNFPDDMPKEQVRALIASKFPEVAQPLPQAAPNAPLAPLDYTQAQQGIKSDVSALGSGFTSMMTGGLSDEIQAGLGAAMARPFVNVPIEELYSQGLEKVRGEQQALREESPISYMAGELAGAVPMAAGITKLGGQALARKAAEAPLKTAAGLGALQGGLYGFGTGEGAEGRLGQAGVSSVLGGAGGVVGGYVGSKIGAKLGKKTADVTTPPSGDFIPQEAASVPTTKAQLKATGMVLDAIKKDYPDRWKEVAEAYEAGRVTLPEIAGENITSLSKGAAQYSGGASVIRPYFEKEVMKAPERIGKSISENISPVRGYFASVDDVLQKGREKAAPLYQKAFNINKSVVSPEIDLVLDTPAGRKALKEAATLMQNDRALMGLPDAELKALQRDATAIGAMDEVSGSIARGLNLRTLDYVKKAMDDQISGAYRQGNNSAASIINRQKNLLLREMDKADKSGAYRIAREVAGDYIKTEKAMELGRQFSKMDTELMRSGWKEMSKQEQEAFKIGMAKSLRDTLDNTVDGRNPYNKIFGTPAMQERFAVIMNPKEYRAFERSIKAEDRLFRMRNEILGGSPTTSKAVAAGKIAAQGFDVADIATGGVTGAVKVALKDRIKMAFDGINDDVAKSIANIVFEPNQENKILMLERVIGSKSLPPQAKQKIAEAFFAVDEAVKSKIIGATSGGALSGSTVNQMMEPQ